MQRIGGYEVVGHLASGGMAEVLLGRHPDGQTVVLKRALSRDAMTAKRLRDEGRLGLRLGWSPFARTLELLEHEGEPVVALEWVDGVPLEALWKVERLSPWATARLGAEVASALAVLHGLSDGAGSPLGAVHRDLSSRNVLVESAGHARVIDLGCACFDDGTRSARTETGNVLGTLRYTAPEVFETAVASQASDLWSLGVLLLECQLGRPLFKGSVGDVAAAVFFKDPFGSPDAASIDARLDKVLRSLLQRNPAARPTAARAAEDLALLADDLETSVAVRDLRRHVERARTAVAAGLVQVGTSQPSSEELAAAAAPTGDIVNPDPTINDETMRAVNRSVVLVEPEAPTVPQGSKRNALHRGEFKAPTPPALRTPTSAMAAVTMELRSVMTTTEPERAAHSSAAAATTVVRAVQPGAAEFAPTIETRAVDVSTTDRMYIDRALSFEVDTPMRPMARGVVDEPFRLPSDASVAGVFRTPVAHTLDIEVVVEEEGAPIHRRTKDGLVPVHTVQVEAAAVVSSQSSPPPMPGDPERAEPTIFVRARPRTVEVSKQQEVQRDKSLPLFGVAVVVVCVLTLVVLAWR